MDTPALKNICTQVRRDIINMTANAGSGHPGGSLSAVEMLVALYFDVMNVDPKNPSDPTRDRLVLSKGHAAPALYAVLGEKGYFDTEEFKRFRQLHSILQGHPDAKKCPGVDASTGSLGQGISIAVGMALFVAACMLLWGKQLLSLFINDQPELVDQVLTVGYRYLSVMSLGLFMLYLLFVYRSTLQGLGDTMIPMVSGIVELAMRIGCALLLPLLVGEWGIYIAEISAWIGAAILLIWGYYHRMRHLRACISSKTAP